MQIPFSDAGGSRIQGCRFYLWRDVIRIGGRGASSGVSDSGRAYGTEYNTVGQLGNIKFVTSNYGSGKVPMETMTKGRVYATINDAGKVKAITYYDKHNKRYKQIDIIGKKHMVDGKKIIPHTHKGYGHDEKGTKNPSTKEKKMIDRVLKAWDTIKGK